ncbi:MAG: hypothetical protein ACK5LC_09775 [Coprobacillaceae bacterium]
MLYADKEYYKNVFKGTLVPDDEIEKRLQDSQDDIDSLTFNRIVAKGFMNLTEFQKSKVQRAMCQQAEFLYTNSAFINLPVASFSAGSVSMSLKVLEIGGIKTEDKVLNLLNQTGLRCLKL